MRVLLTDIIGSIIKDITPIKETLGLSRREYFRITDIKNNNFILMDCNLEPQTIKPFLKIADMLHKEGVFVPKILVSDIENNYLILEDFGKTHIRDIIIDNKLDSKKINQVYQNLVGLIFKLQRLPLNIIEKRKFNKDYRLFIDYYFPIIKGSKASTYERESYVQIMHEITLCLEDFKQVFVMGDYHSENIMFLRNKGSSLGLLDFQDSFIGCPCIDVMSLLQDVRIEVPENVEKNFIKHFVKNQNLDLEKFMINYSILGTIHQLDILGKFYRYSKENPQIKVERYLQLSLCYLKRNLKHPSLYKLKNFLSKYLN